MRMPNQGWRRTEVAAGAISSSDNFWFLLAMVAMLLAAVWLFAMSL